MLLVLVAPLASRRQCRASSRCAVRVCLRVRRQFSRVAVAENTESALHLDELLPSQESNLRAGDLESMWQPVPQMSEPSEALGAPSSLWIRN